LPHTTAAVATALLLSNKAVRRRVPGGVQAIDLDRCRRVDPQERAPTLANYAADLARPKQSVRRSIKNSLLHCLRT
jgi:hypothetical protein